MKAYLVVRRIGAVVAWLLAVMGWGAAAGAMDASGLVTDTQGKPIAAATVEVVELHGVDTWPEGFTQKVVGSAVSGMDGKYTLSVSPPTDPADQVILRALAPGKAYCAIMYRPDFPADQRFAGGTQRGSMRRPWFVMLPEQTIRGIVVDEAGQPVAGCAIRCEPTRQTARSGPDGKFQIDHFTDLSGTPFEDLRRIEFGHPDYLAERMYLRSDQYRVRQPDGTWRIMLKSGVLVSGQVTDQETKEPIPGARIQFDGGAGIVATNAEGRYVIRVRADSQVSITPLRGTLTNPNYVPVERELTQTFAADKVLVVGMDFHYRKGGSISGRVRATSGDLSENPAMVALMGPPSEIRGSAIPRASSGTVAADGTFRLNAIPPGSYELRVTVRPSGSPDLPVASRPVQIVAGQEVSGLTIDAPLLTAAAAGRGARGPQNAAGVWIKVVNPDGTPVPLAVLRTGSGGGVQFTDVNGEFHVERATTSFRLAMASNYAGTLAGLAQLDRTVEPVAPTVITLGPAARISGRVYDADGKPIAGANVQLNFGSPNLGSAWTDADGKYTFTGLVGLQPGERYSVRASQMSGHTITELQPGQELTGVSFRYLGPTNSGARGFSPERE
jgi:protocatechuate 3,4-dioxygenase beta subunit